MSDTVILGNEVKVTCSAEGGNGAYKYDVLYKLSTETKWTGKQYKKTNTDVSIIPAQSGVYNICIKVYDQTETVVKKYINVHVLEAN